MYYSFFFPSWNTEYGSCCTSSNANKEELPSQCSFLSSRGGSTSKPLFSTCCWRWVWDIQTYKHPHRPQRNFSAPERFTEQPEDKAWCYWICKNMTTEQGRSRLLSADSPPWASSFSPVRHISLVARENMVTGFLPSTCLMIGSCPTRPSNWTRFIAETQE